MTKIPVFKSVLNRMPADCRPALYFETLSNIGTGSFLVLFSISLVVLKTILEADLLYSFLLATMFLGSSLFSPIVTYCGRKIPMRLLVIVPNFAVGVLLTLLLIPVASPLLFTLVVGGSYILRVFPRVAEMNLFRVLYPDSHRGTAIGWTRAVNALAGLSITFLSWWWFARAEEWYNLLYAFVGVLLIVGAWFYSRIPVPTHTIFTRTEDLSPGQAFRKGAKVFFRDKRFLQYQAAFAVAGIANHLALFLIPEVMKEETGVSNDSLTFLIVVLPTLLMILTAPLWGRFLDRRNPMMARGLFNTIQCAAYAGYAYGGLTGQLWPFVLGTVCHAVSNGGGNINWLTGSMYFAKEENVSLYNGIHVAMTGIRGIIGPALGYFLFIESASIGGYEFNGAGLGSGVFVIAAVLSFLGFLWMTRLHLTDTGPAVDSLIAHETEDEVLTTQETEPVRVPEP